MHTENIPVKKIIWETRDAFTVVLEDHPMLSASRPGQFLNVICTINGEEISRPYSFSFSPLLMEPPALTIKRMTNGVMSNYLADNLKQGDLLRVSPPGGRFVTHYEKEGQRHFLMISGGSGITPVFSILKSVLHLEPKSRMTLLYANRDQNSIIFRDQLRQLERKYQNRFKVIHFLDSVRGKLHPVNEQIIQGSISEASIRDIVSDYQGHLESLEVWICGPKGLMELVGATLLKFGLKKEQLHTESITVIKEQPLRKATSAHQNDAQVEIENFKGQRVSFPASKKLPVLRSALDQQIKLPHSCREAMCGTCKAKLLSGDLDMKLNYALTDEELAEGYVLLCSGHPVSDKLVLTYDKTI